MPEEYLVHKIFAPLRRLLPASVSDPLRRVVTALSMPVIFSARSGHFKSSMRAAAVSQAGTPLPWYTYPAIDFLRTRPLQGCRVLEFGGGQSTRWWASRAREVVTLEGDPEWYASLAGTLPENVQLRLVSMADGPACLVDVERVIAEFGPEAYDIVIVDGLWRQFLADVACRVVAPHGAIIVDNAEGYETFERYRDRGLNRVDFYGHVPGVVLPQCTSVYFGDRSFLFAPELPIVKIASA